MEQWECCWEWIVLARQEGLAKRLVNGGVGLLARR